MGVHALILKIACGNPPLFENSFTAGQTNLNCFCVPGDTAFCLRLCWDRSSWASRNNGHCQDYSCIIKNSVPKLTQTYHLQTLSQVECDSQRILSDLQVRWLVLFHAKKAKNKPTLVLHVDIQLVLLKTHKKE